MLKQFFVTGTDTGVGKTIVSAILTLLLDGCYWKPFQSGAADEISDHERVQQLTNLDETRFIPSTYTLQASLSPYLAACLENIEIDLAQCVVPSTTKHLIVEGAGGVLVPLTSRALMIDFMQQLNLPIIIVSRGTLGTINHTLLTIQALRQRNLPIYGIIFCGKLDISNQSMIEKISQVRTLFHIPQFNELNKVVLHNWLSEHRALLREKFI